jgi:PST family polysaccharide transporter/lipopolysaccharide exporter
MDNKESLGSAGLIAQQEHSGALQKSLSAGHWFLVDTLMQRVLVFGTFFVTARLLTPADYGIIALAGIYPALLDSLTAIAFETALTQKKTDEEKPYLDVVWTFTILRNALLFFFIFFTAPFVAQFFHAEHATLLFRLGGLILFVQSFGNIGQIYFFRHLDFKKVFLRDMAMYGTNATVTLVTAYVFRSYWAIFAGSVAGILAAAIATYFLNSHRPRFDFSFSKLKPLIPYSQWVFGQGLINRLSQTIENVLIGRFADTTAIGLYGKAKTLATAPTSPLGNIIGKIGFSALVSVQDSKVRVREGFHKSFELAATIALAFLVAIFVGGHQLVLIVLGPAWAGITPFLKILTTTATLDALIIIIAGTIMNALSEPRLLFRLNTLSLLCLVLLLGILVPSHGTYGAAIALLITSVITNSYALILIHRQFGVTRR